MLPTLSSDIKVYEQRNPKQSQFYKCVEDHFERLENIWDDCYQKLYGFLRPHVMKVIYKYLDCGDLHKGFARVKCCDCNHEYLVAFSCKSRHFCPSCHQRRVVEFGEYLSTEVLEDVPHRQWVFSLPKRLRVYFMYDRKLLAKLSRCVNDALSDYLKQTVTFENATPGIVCAVQTFGDFLNFNPHLHIIATDGCFNENNDFMVGLSPKAEDLIPAFKQAIFKLLLKEGKISNAVIENMNSWIHDGFHVYCGKAIYSWDNEGLERLGQYIVRAPLSQERMTYIPEHQTNDGKAKVIYKGKTSKKTQVFSALDWLARLITHIPNKGEQMVKYYGYYSNKSRGMRKKDEEIQKPNEPNECNDISEIDAEINKLMFSNMKRKKFNKSWAKLIHKVYNVDPLKCSQCGGNMKIISFIEEESLIKKILKHLNLWLDDKQEPPNHSPPQHILDLINTNIDILYQQNTVRMRTGNTLINAKFTYYDSFKQESCGYIPQMPFEDEYSQLVPYDD